MVSASKGSTGGRRRNSRNSSTRSSASSQSSNGTPTAKWLPRSIETLLKSCLHTLSPSPFVLVCSCSAILTRSEPSWKLTLIQTDEYVPTSISLELTQDDLLRAFRFLARVETCRMLIASYEAYSSLM